MKSKIWNCRLVVHITSTIRNDTEINDRIESDIKKWEYDFFWSS